MLIHRTFTTIPTGSLFILHLCTENNTIVGVIFSKHLFKCLFYQYLPRD